MNDYSDPNDTVFRDVILAVVVMLVVMLVMLLPWINRPIDPDPDSIPPGNVLITTDWPDGWPVDVDTWVRAPGERPVGYSNKHGPTFDLTRDDLGMTNDTTLANREQVVGRGIPNGRYVVNLHMYANTNSLYPVPVSVDVTLVRTDRTIETIVEREVQLVGAGQEITVVRFQLHDEHVVPGSINEVFQPLRNAPLPPGAFGP